MTKSKMEEARTNKKNINKKHTFIDVYLYVSHTHTRMCVCVYTIQTKQTKKEQKAKIKPKNTVCVSQELENLLKDRILSVALHELC